MVKVWGGGVKVPRATDERHLHLCVGLLLWNLGTNCRLYEIAVVGAVTGVLPPPPKSDLSCSKPIKLCLAPLNLCGVLYLKAF